MLPRLRASLLAVIAILAGAFLPGAARAVTPPVVLSVSYASPNVNQFIGSTITVYIVAVQPSVSTPYSALANPVTNTGLTLNSASFPTIPNNTLVYVGDGTRVWVVDYQTAMGANISIGNGNLLTNAPPSWSVPDYTQIANSSFQIYTGTLVTGASLGAQVSVDIGQFDTQLLYDNASNGDTAAGDGIWTCRYTVPNIGYMTTGTHFFGHCLIAGLPASNDPLQSSESTNFDMLQPAITSVAFTTNKSNYNGDLYLSSLCEGLSAANPANIQPTNAEGRWDFVVNKLNTTVDIVVGTPAVKHLPSYVVPQGATTLAGWRVWAGDDGNQAFAQDGVYPVSYYIHDINGVCGLTRTGQVKVVSLKMGISNISMTPPSVSTQPAFSDGVISHINYTVSLTNDSASSLAMNNSLQALGWSEAGNSFTENGVSVSAQINGIDSAADIFSTIWSVQSIGSINPLGVLNPFTWGSDSYDDDTTLAQYIFFKYFEVEFDAFPPWDEACLPNQTIGIGGGAPDPAAASAYSFNFPVGQLISDGDGDPTNDWRPKGFLPLGTVNGVAPSNGNLFNPTGTLAPVTISAQFNYTWTGATPLTGSYRMDFQSQLTGIDFYELPPPSAPNAPDPCSPTVGNVFTLEQFHFWPQSMVDTPSNDVSGRHQGDAITCTDTSYIFTVVSTALPTGDNAPPEFLSSNPANGSTIAPNTFNSTTPLTAQFLDPNTPVNTSGQVTYITLLGPNNSYISGQSSTNGGAAGGNCTVSFTPFGPLDTGGSYTMNIFICATNGLCEEQTVLFTVKDETAPAISAVALTSQTAGQIPLSLLLTGAQGPYQNISQIAVTLAFPNTTQNTIDWADSNVSLYQISGTARIPIVMTRLTTGTPSDSALHYSVTPPITTAGQFEIDTQTVSQDSSGNRYTGPAPVTAGTNTPIFATTLNNNAIDVTYSNNPSASRPAITGQLPITVTSQGVPVASVATIAAQQPASLPADTLYTRLPTVNNNNQLGFNIGTGILSTPLVWQYATTPAVTFGLYYDDTDLAATTQTGAVVSASNLVVRGYTGSGWVTVPPTSVDTTAVTNNAFYIAAPNGQAAMVYYAIAYQASLTQTSGVVVTPLSFSNTRAFNPNNVNPVYRQARFYYGNVAPATIEARVFDTSGQLVRDLTLGNGISAANNTTDPFYNTSQYWFAWDGTNDSGAMVHNGLYLVRWTFTGVDGSTSTQTKPVALIK